MNSQELFDAFAKLSDPLLDEFETIENMQNQMKKTHYRTYIVTILLCVAIGICIIGFFSRDDGLFLTITAYAKNSNGENIASEMTLNKEYPISVYPMGSGASAFVFSYPCQSLQEHAHFSYIFPPSEIPGEGQAHLTVAYTPVFQQNNGSTVYIYYIFYDECPCFDFSYNTIPDEKNQRYTVSISVSQKNGTYYARLNAITPFEPKSSATTEYSGGSIVIDY